VAHGGQPATDAPPQTARRRYAAGRRVAVPATVRKVRDLIRRHMREEGRDMGSLAAVWNVKRETVKTIMHHGRPLSPQYVDAFIEALKLDEFDALELRFQGALEAGWQLQPLKQKARV
jgi:hypothetical protein